MNDIKAIPGCALGFRTNHKDASLEELAALDAGIEKARRLALIANGAHPDFKNDFDKNSGFAPNATPVTLEQLEAKWAKEDSHE